MRFRDHREGLRRTGAALLLWLCAAPVMADAPVLAGVRFEGDAPYPERRARRVAAMRPGEPFDPAAAQAAAQRLMEACRVRYHPLARVAWQAFPAQDSDGLLLVFQTAAGPRGRLAELRFTGQEALTADMLESAMAVRPPWGLCKRWTGRDILRIEDIDGDQEALLRLYGERGLLEVEVGAPELEWVEALGGFRLTWPILHEGPVYTIGSVRIDTDYDPSVETLPPAPGLAAGDPLDLARVQAAAGYMQGTYHLRGYPFAEVEAEISWAEDEARGDVRFLVRRGTAPRLRDVAVTGQAVTRERVIRRELPLQRGDPFDPEALWLAHERLEATGLFSMVDVAYSGRPDGAEYDIEIELREKRTGRVDVGVLYGEEEGFAVQLMATERNLALRPPFRGDALQARLGATAGPRILRFETGWRNPRWGASRWSLDGLAFYEDNTHVSTWFNQRSHGGHVQASHPAGRHHVLSAAYTWSAYSLYNLDPAASRMTSAPVDLALTSLAGSWTWDRTDRFFRPTRGTRLESGLFLGSRLLGGDTDVVQANLLAGIYGNPYGDHVISLRAGGQTVTPYGATETVPLPLRLYLGGSGNLRGFEYRSVSPRDATGRAVGGQSAWWASLEYLLPVLAWLDLAAYLDAGDVASDSWSWDVRRAASNGGFGALIRAENFPVRFDLAWPFTVPEGYPPRRPGEPRLSFSVGYRF